MHVWFLIAATMSGLTMLIHLFVGGRFLARPLLESSLHQVVRTTLYFCWHMVTITIAAMAVLFGLAFVDTSYSVLAIVATVLAGAFCLLNLALILRYKQSMLRMPQWFLFMLITTFGILGLL